MKPARAVDDNIIERRRCGRRLHAGGGHQQGGGAPDETHVCYACAACRGLQSNASALRVARFCTRQRGSNADERRRRPQVTRDDPRRVLLPSVGVQRVLLARAGWRLRQS